MTSPSDIVAYNRCAWDHQVQTDNEWTRPVSTEVVQRARQGDWSVVLIGYEPVDRSWFPPDLAGRDVLCLASGGGQQGPILAAAGATVTVFDNSPLQLGQDTMVAERDGLSLRTVVGDMTDLSAFGDASFDLVFHPVSNLFAPQIRPVWRECYRVLRPGGCLLVGFVNPDVFIFDIEALDERGELIVRYSLPYADTDLPPEQLQRLRKAGTPLAYSHSMADQIGGQLDAGFVLTGFAQAPHHADATARYLPGYFATRAVKPA
jgi:SAM-dependent methyltransferase